VHVSILVTGALV